MKKKEYQVSKDDFERIYRHSYNLYSAIEEMYEDFKILYKTLEKVRTNPNSLDSKIVNLYKSKFD